MKRLLALGVACLVVIALSTCALAVMTFQSMQYESVTAYATAAFVAGIDGDTVTLEDSDGNQWQTEGAEDWETGDLIVLMMHDNGTPENLEDDVILSAEYSGFCLG